MGDYADMALEAGFSSWSDEEPDEYIGGSRRRRPRELKTCQRCGATDLVWIMDDDWVLSDDGHEPHVCPPASADDFEVLE